MTASYFVTEYRKVLCFNGFMFEKLNYKFFSKKRNVKINKL